MVIEISSNIKYLYIFLSFFIAIIISSLIVRLFRLLFKKEYKKKLKNNIIFKNSIEKKIFLTSFITFTYIIFNVFIVENIIANVLIMSFIFILYLNLSFKFIDYLFNNFFNVDFEKNIHVGYSKISKIMEQVFKLVLIIFLVLVFLLIFKVDLKSIYDLPVINHLMNIVFVVLVDAVFVLTGFFLYNIVKKILIIYANKSKIRLDNFIYKMLETPLIFMFVFLGIKFSFSFLDLSQKMSDFINLMSDCAITVFILVLIIRIVDEVYFEIMLAKRKKDITNNQIEQIGPLIKGIIKVIVISIGLIILLDFFGVNVNSLIAGLGIGGIAVALAAQDTLSNFFGSISIFSDKPFKIGDRVVTGGFDGFIQEVGIRSTRIKLLSGNFVSIPNSKLAKDSIENVSLRESIKEVTTINLTYSTSASEIKKGVEIIKSILKRYEDEKKLKEGSIVFFNKISSYSLDILVIFWLDELDWLKAMYIKEEIYYEIYNKFNEEGLEFAFPSQTIYVKND